MEEEDSDRKEDGVSITYDGRICCVVLRRTGLFVEIDGLKVRRSVRVDRKKVGIGVEERLRIQLMKKEEITPGWDAKGWCCAKDCERLQLRS